MQRLLRSHLMMNLQFSPPVPIAFGQSGQVRQVTSVPEATYCVLSDSWPSKGGLMRKLAARALVGATEGHLTPAEARQAFIDAALEARILVVDSFPS
jgi:hypothetical protein